MNKKPRCRWHQPDGKGQYSFARFENPAGGQTIDMFFNGAQITLRMKLNGAEVAHMNYPINFCPVCGERVRMEAEDDADAE